MDLLKMKKCVLCGCKNLKVIQNISTKEIIDLYNYSLHIDVSKEFKGEDFVESLKCNSCKLVFFNPLFSGSEKFYENLQNLEQGYYSCDRPEFFEALKYINNKDSVLEIGSGSALFAEKLNVSKYLGLEYNDKAIIEAKKRNINLVKQSIENFSKTTNDKFDVVCSFHVLEHLENPKSFIESSLKILKKGGKMIIAVPCSNSFLVKNTNHVLNLPPHHISRWEADTFKTISELYKLKILKLNIDKVENTSNYFEFKYTYIINNLFSGKKVVNYNKLYFTLNKVVKKLNRKLNLYKLEKNKNQFGRNMLVIFEK